MKKLLVLILCLALTFVPTACTSDNTSKVTDNTAANNTTADNTVTNSTDSDNTAANSTVETNTVTDNAESGTDSTSSLNTGNLPAKPADSLRSGKAAEISQAINPNIIRTQDKSRQSKTPALAAEVRVRGIPEDELKINLRSKLQFSAKTVEDKPVDSSIFKDYKLTMINVWGTLCKPCIAEMSDIQKLYEEMKGENVNVIGFIANSEQDRQEKAQQILKAKGVTFMNILFDDKLSGQISAQVSGYPTTIFVDCYGNVIGKQISGAKGKDEYKKEIENRLKELQKQQQ